MTVRELREIVGKAYTELGRELTEARDRLAGSNQYDGVFESWYIGALGFNRKRVNRLIQRYDLVVTNCHKQDLLEDLPVSLTYDIAKPSAESTPAKAQAKAEVLAGDIATYTPHFVDNYCSEKGKLIHVVYLYFIVKMSSI